MDLDTDIEINDDDSDIEILNDKNKPILNKHIDIDLTQSIHFKRYNNKNNNNIAYNFEQFCTESDEDDDLEILTPKRTSTKASKIKTKTAKEYHLRKIRKSAKTASHLKYLEEYIWSLDLFKLCVCAFLDDIAVSNNFNYLAPMYLVMIIIKYLSVTDVWSVKHSSRKLNIEQLSDYAFIPDFSDNPFVSDVQLVGARPVCNESNTECLWSIYLDTNLNETDWFSVGIINIDTETKYYWNLFEASFYVDVNPKDPSKKRKAGSVKYDFPNNYADRKAWKDKVCESNGKYNIKMALNENVLIFNVNSQNFGCSCTCILPSSNYRLLVLLECLYSKTNNVYIKSYKKMKKSK